MYLIINSRVNRKERAYKARARVLKGYFEAFEQQPVVAEATFAVYTSHNSACENVSTPKTLFNHDFALQRSFDNQQQGLGRVVNKLR